MCAGANDVLTKLEDRIAPNAVVVFDEVGAVPIHMRVHIFDPGI